MADWARTGTAKLPRLVDIIVEFSFEVSTTKNDSDRQAEQGNRDAVLVENVENGGNDRREGFYG